MPLNVLAVADQTTPLLYEYFCPDRWGEIDVVVSCGDLSPDYLDFLCTNLSVPVLYVRGNHDATVPSHRYDGCVNIHARMVTVGGVRFMGFEGSRKYNDGSCQYTEREMRWRMRRTRARTAMHGAPDVLVTHAPAAGCHDGDDICHRGFDCFRQAIEGWAPSFFIHGHTHAYYGREHITTLESTTVMNAFPYRVFQVEAPARARNGMKEDRPVKTVDQSLGVPLSPTRRTEPFS